MVYVKSLLMDQRPCLANLHKWILAKSAICKHGQQQAMNQSRQMSIN